MSSNFLNPVTTQTWANGRHLVRCVKVIQETWDVRTFCFMADQPILFFFAGPVRHPGAGDRRRAGDALLHHLQLALGALQLLHHHQAGAGRAGFQLAARQPQGRPGATGARSGRPVQRHRLPGRQGAVPLRRGRHHPGNVHGALVLRHQRQRRHGLRPQRPFAEGHHLPPRAGAHGLADRQLQPAHHLRAPRPRRSLGRLPWLPEPAHAGTYRPGLPRAGNLLLRPDALYERGEAPAAGPRLRHEPLPRGSLRADSAGGPRRRQELAAEAAEAPEVPVADQHQVEFTATGKSIRVSPGKPCTPPPPSSACTFRRPAGWASAAPAR